MKQGTYFWSANEKKMADLEVSPNVRNYKYKIEQTAKSAAQRQREYRLRHRYDPEYRERKRRQDREYLQNNQERRMKYKGKHKIVGKARIGVCNMCRAVKGIDCKQTQWHHIEYDDIHKERYSIELCASCHRKETTLQLGKERIKEIARRGGYSHSKSHFSEMGKRSIKRRIEKEGIEHYMERLNPAKEESQ